MPIPTPTTEESKPDFLARCMSDAKMLTEYPDAAQRYAICEMQYNNDNV